MVQDLAIRHLTKRAEQNDDWNVFLDVVADLGFNDLLTGTRLWLVDQFDEKLAWDLIGLLVL
jgi:hypothetical protein